MTSTNVRKGLSQQALQNQFHEPLQQALSGGLSDLTIAELLGITLSHLTQAERTAYLEREKPDKGNGCYERGLQVGSVPVTLQVPRTRTGDFRPTFLPLPYERGYPEATQQQLLGLLAASRSIHAATTAIRKMGLSVSDSEVATIASEFVEEIDLCNSRPIAPDLLAIFFDGKYVEI